jgi:hypothetical protein
MFGAATVCPAARCDGRAPIGPAPPALTVHSPDLPGRNPNTAERNDQRTNRVLPRSVNVKRIVQNDALGRKLVEYADYVA